MKLITNNNQLDELAKSIAYDILQEIKIDDTLDVSDLTYEFVDDNEHILYPHKAHSICRTCDIEEGYRFLEDVGPPEPLNYDTLATLLVYGELRSRVTKNLEKLGIKV